MNFSGKGSIPSLLAHLAAHPAGKLVGWCFRFFTAVIALLMLGGTLVAQPAIDVTVKASFKNASEPGWVVTGQAHFTSGQEDPDGNGWLRLTDNKNNQASFVYYDSPFPFNSGFRVIFNYAFWGQGNNAPADGVAFVLFDANVTQPQPGGFGGSLGYAQKSGIAGLPGAILGIGLDSFGNYSNPTEGCNGGPGFVPYTATIRGPGDGTANLTTGGGRPNYGFLVTSGALSSSLLELGDASVRPQAPGDYRRATVTVDTSRILQGTVPVTVDIVQGNNASVRVIAADIYQQLIAYYGSPENLPPTVKFGFTGGTGGNVDYHDIREMTVEISNITGPRLRILKSHSGSFERGSTGVYSIRSGTPVWHPLPEL